MSLLGLPQKRLAPLKKGGSRLEVPLFKGDLGGSYDRLLAVRTFQPSFEFTPPAIEFARLTFEFAPLTFKFAPLTFKFTPAPYPTSDP
jgi:hypothetical protein